PGDRGGRAWCPLFFFSSRRRHTRFSRDWSSDVCSFPISDSHRLEGPPFGMLQVDDLDPVIDLRRFPSLKLFPGQAQEFLRVFHVLEDDEVKAVNRPALEAPYCQRLRVAHPFLA